MIKSRTLRRLNLSAMVGCAMMAGSVFSSACTLTDLRDNIISGSLGAVKTYVGNFWGALFPTPQEVIDLAQANGVPIPDPPW